MSALNALEIVPGPYPGEDVPPFAEPEPDERDRVRIRIKKSWQARDRKLWKRRQRRWRRRHANWSTTREV